MTSQGGNTQAGALELVAADELAGDETRDLLAQAGFADEEAAELGDLVEALELVLRGQEPDSQFAQALHAKLVSQPRGPLKRARQMPARLSMAAALAVMAGFALFMLRRLFGSDTPQDMQEEAVVRPL